MTKRGEAKLRLTDFDEKTKFLYNTREQSVYTDIYLPNTDDGLELFSKIKSEVELDSHEQFHIADPGNKEQATSAANVCEDQPAEIEKSADDNDHAEHGNGQAEAQEQQNRTKAEHAARKNIYLILKNAHAARGTYAYKNVPEVNIPPR